MKLTNRSLNIIILRVLILFFLCIYIPVEIIFGPYFNVMEHKIIFDSLNTNLPEFFKSHPVIFITDALVYFFSDKDMIMLYMGIFYMVFHPFIAMKIIFVTHFVQFVFVMMRCLYQAYRPIWVMKLPLTDLCLTSYAHPSMHFFFVTFFYLYLIISIRLANKKKGVLTIKRKILTLIMLILIFVVFGSLMVLKGFNYLYQLVFAFTLSLLTIVVLLDLETIIHNHIFNSLKNIFKIRKHKIKLFLVVLGLNIMSICIYNFIQVEALDLLASNEILDQHCTEAELTNIGLKSTFNDITYIYGVLGAYFGTSLTVEKNCGEWWYSSWKNNCLKIFITLVFGGFYIFIFSLYHSKSFEFNYFVFSIKYILFNYIMMGCLPLLFGFIKLNRKISKEFLKKKSIFAHSLFSSTHSDNNINKLKNRRENIESKLPDYIKNKALYSRSIIVGGMEAKNNTLENLDFLLGQNTLENGNFTLDDKNNSLLQ